MTRTNSKASTAYSDDEKHKDIIIHGGVSSLYSFSGASSRVRPSVVLDMIHDTIYLPVG